MSEQPACVLAGPVRMHDRPPGGGWRCRRAICSALTTNSVRVWSAIDHPTIRRLAGRATRRTPTAISSAPRRPPTRQFSPREVPGRTGTLCWEDVLPGEIGRGSFQGLDFHFQYTVLAPHLGQLTTLVTGQASARPVSTPWDIATSKSVSGRTGQAPAAWRWAQNASIHSMVSWMAKFSRTKLVTR